MIKNVATIALTALVCLAGFIVYLRFAHPQPLVRVDSTVLLERVDKVFKLVTVEGNFSELYTYENHIFADVWPFRKKAIVQVKAKVAIGYDFENVQFDVDEEKRTLTIKGDLLPEILSIDHDIKDYDFENGLFNMISDRDITTMGDEVKTFIKEKAAESDLYDRAEDQKSELLDMLKWMLEASGWTLITDDSKLLN